MSEPQSAVNCPKCGQGAYYVQHNGGFVWVDELGPPWPKHPCFDCEVSREIHRQLTRGSGRASTQIVSNVTAKDRMMKCEFCGAIVRPSRCSQHVERVHKAPKSSAALAGVRRFDSRLAGANPPALDGLGRRQCERND